jgi:hypothetical protein
MKLRKSTNSDPEPDPDWDAQLRIADPDPGGQFLRYQTKVRFLPGTWICGSDARQGGGDVKNRIEPVVSGW